MIWIITIYLAIGSLLGYGILYAIDKYDEFSEFKNELNKIDDEGYSGRVIIILVFTLFWVPIYLWNIIFPEK